MNRKEREALKLQILRENELLQKNRKLNRNFLSLAGIFLLLSVWAFSGARDVLLPNISPSLVTLMKVIFVVLAIILAVLSVLGILSYRNGKRRVLYLMDIVSGKEKFPKPEH